MRRRSALGMACLLCLASGVAWAAEYDATIQWARRAALGAAVSGIVAQVPVAEGSRVRKGQILVQLEEKPYQAILTQAQARLRRSKRERLEAERELNRARELFDREVLSTVEREQADLVFVRADTAFREAEARRDEAAIALAHTQVRAPFAGLVVRRQVEVGEYLNVTIHRPPLVVVADVSTYVARVALDAESIGTLSTGGQARVKVAGQLFSGRVKTIGLEPFTESGLYAVDIEFVAPGVSLRGGLPARVEL